MIISNPIRIFDSSKTTTLCVTIPAQVVSGSQFLFNGDDAGSITIDGDQVVITSHTEEIDT